MIVYHMVKPSSRRVAALQPKRKVPLHKLIEQRKQEVHAKSPGVPVEQLARQRKLRQRRRSSSGGSSSGGPNLKVIAGVVAIVLLIIGLFSSTKENSSLAGWGTQPLPNEDFSGFNTVQQHNGSIIVRVGQEMGMPERAWVIAVATAMQECGLRNCANSNKDDYPEVRSVSQSLPHQGESPDHDSVGLFQQRPSNHGGEGKWGTVEELMQPKIAAQKFYNALQKVKGWETMDLTVAAQRVQNSKYGDRYAKHETRAKALVDYVRKHAPVKD